MFIDFTESMLKAGMQALLAEKYGVSKNEISDVSFDTEELLTANFSNEVFNNQNKYMLVNFILNGYPVQEAFKDQGLVYQIAENFIISELNIKKDSFEIAEMLPPGEYKRVPPKTKGDEQIGITALVYRNEE